jgi:hypothetical protein
LASGRFDAPPQVVDLLLWNLDLEGRMSMAVSAAVLMTTSVLDGGGGLPLLVVDLAHTTPAHRV